jgi:excisionase family DNA binding protein
MKTLESIKKALMQLRSHPEPDEATFNEAASMLRAANDIAVQQGIQIEPVGSLCTPATALTIVSGYIKAIQPEWLSAAEAATLLGVSQSKVADWIQADRLDAVNVAGKGKRASYRIHRLALSKLKPESKPVRRYKPPREII